MSLGLVYASPYSYSNDTIFFNVTATAIRQNSQMIWKEGIPIQAFETDSDLKMEYQIINKSKFSLRAVSTSNIPQYQLIFCSVVPLPKNNDKYRMNTTFKKCPYFWEYHYNFSYFTNGQKYLFDIPTVAKGQNGFKWIAGNGDEGGEIGRAHV